MVVGMGRVGQHKTAMSEKPDGESRFRPTLSGLVLPAGAGSDGTVVPGHETTIHSNNADIADADAAVNQCLMPSEFCDSVLIAATTVELIACCCFLR
jgi:hypothetical protein